jgi:hypothetical protein
MPWRVIAYGDEVWHVEPVAERPAHDRFWHLVLSFRGTSGGMRDHAFWAQYPIEATSKSALFLQADRIPDAALSHFLVERRL